MEKVALLVNMCINLHFVTSVNVPIFKSGKQLKCCSSVKQVGHVCDCFAPNVV